MILVVAGLVLADSVAKGESAVRNGSPSLGINLSAPMDWNTELPFVDVFRLSRPWISQKRGLPWGKGPELALDQHGWVKRLEPDCWAEALMCTIEGGHYPSGTYTVRYDGTGRLEAGLAATTISRAPGQLRIHVDAARGGFSLKLLETDPRNPLRNIRVVMPGIEQPYEENPFHPAFLKRWRDVSCIRFMDWMLTNGSEIETWAERPTMEHATFATRGVPLELMIDLCNRLHADAWFCMPHKANDEYVRKSALMVRNNLHPDLKAYVEYSNEVWNDTFPQSRFAREKAQELDLGPAERPWEGGGAYYARRSAEIFDIWEHVLGGTDRMVRVLAWQAGNTWWMTNVILKEENIRSSADALAIAPYIGLNVPASGDALTASDVAEWSVDDVLDHVQRKSLPDAIAAIEETKKVADRCGLQMIAYEGGQHMVGIQGGENNASLVHLLHRANRDPRMADIYRRYFHAWESAGGGLFCYFSAVSKWSKWGSWGIMQFYDDDPDSYPRYVAVKEWARKIGQPLP